MKADEQINQRLKDLEIKAEAIAQTRKQQTTVKRLTGEPYFEISSSQFKGWGTSVLGLLQRVFGEESPHYKNFMFIYHSYTEDENEFEQARAIFLAAKEDYEGGYLFNYHSLVAAEVLDDALEQAKELVNAGYKDPACVVAGVTLETALKDLCSRKSIVHAKLDTMNVELYKAGTYNLPKQKQITAWADLRNKAAHGDWNAYNEQDVRDMISGVERFIAEYM